MEYRTGFFRPKKKLGQSFLISRHVAVAEAAHADGKNVLELGPGYGILTRELCSRAGRVIAVELDKELFLLLKHEIKAENLVLINKDFFKATNDELELSDTDIMISNIPYSLSSSTIDFLARNRLQAVLCLQKEFVEHMLAAQDTEKYSRLSVMSQLTFRMNVIMKVSRKNFRPVPKVDSCVIYLKPLETNVSEKEAGIINALMQHKKKSVRNAIMDAGAYLKLGKDELKGIADSLGDSKKKLFKLTPEEILDLAISIIKSDGQ